ncbi:MAG: hypothetical protein P1P63_07690 [Treponemataceae bacterium]
MLLQSMLLNGVKPLISVSLRDEKKHFQINRIVRDLKKSMKRN